ncbi:MAG: DUF4861 family protein [Bacteroidota bacterium]
MIKNGSARTFKNEGSGNSWGYLATYGKQSVTNDNLGLVVLFPREMFVGFHEDRFNNVVEVFGSNLDTNYYFAAAWNKNQTALKTKQTL